MKRFTMSFGRLPELRQRKDASLLAVKPGIRWDDEHDVTVYKSRAALEVFLEKGGPWHAVIKTPTHPNMLVNPCYESPI